jgi:hypothetical protein
MQSTSGCCDSIHSVTRGSRAVKEFTFHVASRISSPPIDDHEQEIGLAGGLPAHRRPPVSLAGPGGQPIHGHLELERFTGDDLAPEARPLDPAEERQLAGIARVEQHGDAPELRHRLDHQHPGEGRAPREVAAEECLVTRQLPSPGGGDARVDRGQLGDEEKGWPVGQDIGGSGKLRHGSGPALIVPASCRLSSPVPSWRAPSWPSGAFLAATFFLGAFLAAATAFFAFLVAFFAARPPSSPRPSW